MLKNLAILAMAAVFAISLGTAYAMDHDDVCDRSPSVRDALEDYFKLPCDRISPSFLSQVGKRKDDFLKVGAGSIKRSDFKGLTSLETIVFSSLQEVPTGAFETMPKLKSVWIYHPRGIEIARKAFGAKSKSVHFHSTYNTAAQIMPGAFVGSQFDRLLLPFIPTYPSQALQGINADQLEIPTNWLTRGNLKHVSSARDIELGGSAGMTTEPARNLSKIDFGAFEGMPPVRTVHLEIGASDKPVLFHPAQLEGLNSWVFEVDSFASSIKPEALANLPRKITHFDLWLHDRDVDYAPYLAVLKASGRSCKVSKESHITPILLCR